MTFILRKILLITTLFMASACSSSDIEVYKEMEPKIDLQEFFTGPIRAWGVVQNRSGKVIRRFDVEMFGSWKDGVGTLDETFKYYDGEVDERIWTITKTPSGYEGRADDILGPAKGTLSGNAIRWAYTMDLPVGDTTYRVKFDDYMWQMNDGVIINRSYIKKFGFTVAELTIFMQKQDK